MNPRRSALTRPAILAGACCLAGLLATSPVHATVYKYVDADGVTHYTDRKPPSSQSYQVLIPEPLKRAGKLDWARVPLNLTDFTAEVERACARYGVDVALVRAVIHAESWFNSRAMSHQGAQGLMQLMPATQSRYGVSNPFDSWQNISAGVRHLKGLLEMFRGDERLAAAAYNAGENAVLRHGGIPPYPETRTYVERVFTLKQRYQQAL